MEIEITARVNSSDVGNVAAIICLIEATKKNELTEFEAKQAVEALLYINSILASEQVEEILDTNELVGLNKAFYEHLKKFFKQQRD